MLKVNDFYHVSIVFCEIGVTVSATSPWVLYC